MAILRRFAFTGLLVRNSDTLVYKLETARLNPRTCRGLWLLPIPTISSVG